MPKIKITRDTEGKFSGITWHCPACDTTDDSGPGTGAHCIPVRWLPPGETDESPTVTGKPHWDFNGDLYNPVLTPSVLTTWSEWVGHGQPNIQHVCHFFIGSNGANPGQVTFCSDSTHQYAGQTIDLVDVGFSRFG